MLMEVLIALTLITVVMAAVGVEYVSALANTGHQRASVNATQVATTAMSEVRALDPSDLVTGRTQAAVTTERDRLRAIDKVRPWLSGAPENLAYNDASQTTYARSIDNGGTDTSVRVGVPTAPAVRSPGSVDYRVYKYLECASSAPQITNPDGTTTQRNCSPASRANGTANYLRVVIAIVWTARGCPLLGCAFVTATLIDAHANPTFDLNQPLPPAPVVQNPGAQTVAVDDKISLQLAVQDGKGVLPFTWSLSAGTLPSGLTLSPAGLISGTVTGSSVASTNVSVEVTDAFIRNAQATFSFTVLPRLVFTPISAQANLTTDSVNLALAASGGAGSPFSFSDPKKTLPPGLIVSGSAVTGTPTRTGTYPVSLTVADKSLTRTATVTFLWTVTFPPLAVAAPGTRTSTVSQPIVGLQINASGGAGGYSYLWSGQPTGLSLNTSTGLITGTPTAVGTATVTVTVTDPAVGSKSVTFTWRVLALPTVVTPADQRTTRGAPVSLQVSSTCPNSPCSFSLDKAPDNIVIDPRTGKITGTPSATARTSGAVTVSVSDADRTKVTSSSFAWTVYDAPTIATSASAYTTAVTASPSVTANWTCPHGPCTLSLSSAVPGIGLSTFPTSAADNTGATTLTVTAASGTVYLTGRVQNSATGSNDTSTTTYQPTITVTDADADSITDSEKDTWTALRRPSITSPGNVTVSRNGTASVAVTAVCATNATKCQVTLDGAPSGISVTSSSGIYSVGGRVATGATLGNYTVVLTVTQKVGKVTTSIDSYGTWTVTTP